MKRVRTAVLYTILLFIATVATAQTSFKYQGNILRTNNKQLYVNAKHTVERNYTFRTVNEALHFAERNKGQDTLYTEIYVAPSVYWIDNPDDNTVRNPLPGSTTPFAMTININRLKLIGLGNTPDETVLACNRGQTQGANGNFTMFHFIGDNISAENITFGNYCNVDLIYKRDISKNRTKRKTAIVQAQLAICDGDNYTLRNCRFISRLNLCPFVGAKHTVFEDCYFECTDDALCGTGVYRNCAFTFYSSKPFYTTDKTIGATFINCDIHSKTRGTQYLTKVSGPVTMIDCRWTSDDPNLKIEWNKRPDPHHRCIMQGCTLNGKPLNVPTPTEPLPVLLPPFAIQNQPRVIPGKWTIDSYKPKDTTAYDWQADTTHNAWGYAEGTDGAEGSWGMIQLQKGARLMFTPLNEKENVTSQTCTITMDPCKGPGQGFGSATGQYLDICIKFNTRTLTGYGIRFIRTPEYDHAVETYLVEYDKGEITRISEPQRCDIFKRGCSITLTANNDTLHAAIRNINFPDYAQNLTCAMPHPNTYGGFQLQHTGSTGASATVIKDIFLK